VLRLRSRFAPALTRAGLHLDRVIHADTWRDVEVLPVMEEGVRCPGLPGVVGELGCLSLTASCRLQHAAEASGVVALVLRRWRGARSQGRVKEQGSVAATRWLVTALPSAPLTMPGPG
jgi:protein ImuA